MDTSHGYFTLSLPTVMRHWLAPSFWFVYLHTKRSYVTFLSLVILLRWKHFIVCVLVIPLFNLSINRSNLFSADCVHVDGSLIRCIYSICLPVSGWTIDPMTSCFWWHQIFCPAAISLYTYAITRSLTAINKWCVVYLCMGGSRFISLCPSLLLSKLSGVLFLVFLLVYFSSRFLSLVGTLGDVPSFTCADLAFLLTFLMILNVQFQVTGRVTPVMDSWAHW